MFHGLGGEDIRTKTPSSGVLKNTPSAGVLGGIGKSLVQKLLDVGQLTFFKNYSRGNTVTAEYSKPLDVTPNSNNVQVNCHSWDATVNIISTTGNVSPGGTKEYFMDSRQYLIRQNGTLIGCAIYIGTGTLPTSCQIRVWRENNLTQTYGAGTFTLVGASENFVGQLSANTTNVVVFGTPITGVQEGDFYSILITTSTANALATVDVDPPYNKVCTFTNGTDTVNSASHGFTNGTVVTFYTRTGTMAGGINTTYDSINPQSYYSVINATADTFQISLTQGGSAVDITSDGSGTLFVCPAFYSASMYTSSGAAADGVQWRSQTRSFQVEIPVYLYMAAPTFVALGDSLTAGYPNHTPYMNYLATGIQSLNTIRFNDPEESYPNYLGVLTGYAFQNAGIGGHTTVNMDTRFDTDVKPWKPRFCIIMGGANDISQGVSQSSTIAAVTSIIDKCVANGIIPVLLAILPWTGATNTQATAIDALNVLYRALIEAYPTGKWIDARSTIGMERVGGSPTPPAGNYWDIQTAYNSDGIHFTPAGYSALATYINSQLPSLFATGAKPGIFSATRSSSAPATYYDSSHVLQVITTSNTARYTSGVYTSSGFTSAPGILMEPASTNYELRSDGTQYSGGQMTGWVGPSATVTGTPVYSNVLIPELSGIANAASQRMQYTGVAGDSAGTLSLIYRTALTAVGAFAQNDLFTFSFWARTQTGCTGFTPFATAIVTNSASSGLTSVNLDLAAAGLDSTWRRFFATGTCTHASSSRIYFYLGAVGGTSGLGIGPGETLDIEIAMPQIEKAIKFPTSFIPTTTSALTRGAETLKYGLKATNNRTAATETILIRSLPFFAANEPAADVLLISSDTIDRRIEVNTNGTFSGFGNITDSNTSVATSTGVVSRNTSKLYSVALSSTGNPNAASYINGSLDGSTNTDFTAPAWTPTDAGASYFWIGTDSSGTSGFSGIIQSVAIYAEVLNATENATLASLI